MINKAWFKDHKVHLITGAAVVGVAAIVHNCLPQCVTVDGLFKDVKALWYEIMWDGEKPENVKTITLMFTEPGIMLGKVFLKGREVELELGKDEAMDLAFKIYDAFGESFEKVKIGEF